MRPIKRTLTVQDWIKSGAKFDMSLPNFIYKKNLYIENKNFYEIFLCPFNSSFYNDKGEITKLLVDKESVELLTSGRYSSILLVRNLPVVTDNITKQTSLSLKRIILGIDNKQIRLENRTKKNLHDLRKSSLKVIEMNPYDHNTNGYLTVNLSEQVINNNPYIIAYFNHKPENSSRIYCTRKYCKLNDKISKQDAIKNIITWSETKMKKLNLNNFVLKWSN